MLSGRRLDLLDPTPLDIEIEDIAHGLAFVARWNGQTRGDWPYSVAEHSLLVEQIYGRLGDPPPRWRMAALLHDAPEYVIGDLISPFKVAIGIDYKVLEHTLQTAIHVRFGLPAKASGTLTTLFKKADLIAAYYEATQLAGFEPDVARRFFGVPPKTMRTPRLTPLATAEAQAQFMDRFRRLAA